jgi:hypothetical protein
MQASINGVGGAGVRGIFQKIPFIQAAPSQSLAFPEFTPEILDNDDRVLNISHEIHRILTAKMSEHRPQEGKSIEIEAKIGNVIFTDMQQLQQLLVQAMMNDIKKRTSWQVLMPQRVERTTIYKFESAVPGDEKMFY